MVERFASLTTVYMAEIDKIDSELEKENKVEERIRDLSGKVKTTAEERDKMKAEKEAETQARTTAEKERDFYKDFSKLSSKFPNAGEHQDKILEKVKVGYTVEDATVAVLNSAGKLLPQKEETNAGGSATTPPPKGNKSVEEMTQAEKKEILKEILIRG